MYLLTLVGTYNLQFTVGLLWYRITLIIRTSNVRQIPLNVLIIASYTSFYDGKKLMLSEKISLFTLK